MNETAFIVGGALCVTIAIGIIVASAQFGGGRPTNRFAGIGGGMLVLVVGLGLLLNAFRTSAAMLMPVLAVALVVGWAGGMLASRAMSHRSH
jgi:hypothetical protein